MKTNSQTVLSFALLGLIRLRQPCSGYDLRQMFANSPMGNYSDSPGSIYPALKRLEESQLVSSVVEDSGKVRRRKLYRLSPTGKRALKQWLTSPITQHDFGRKIPEFFLRFAFLEDCLGPKECFTFLKSLEANLELYTAFLKEHFQAIKAQMSRSARLALQSGIMGSEVQLQWVKIAQQEFRNR